MIRPAGFLAILILLASLVSCNQKTSPESVLKKYVYYRFTKDQVRSEIMDWLADPLRTKYEELSDEEFDKSMLNQDLKLLNFRVINNNCEENGICFVTYLVKYETVMEGKKAFTTETKKIAQLIKINGDWKISDVNNSKTVHDSHVPISP